MSNVRILRQSVKHTHECLGVMTPLGVFIVVLALEVLSLEKVALRFFANQIRCQRDTRIDPRNIFFVYV